MCSVCGEPGRRSQGANLNNLPMPPLDSTVIADTVVIITLDKSLSTIMHTNVKSYQNYLFEFDSN